MDLRILFENGDMVAVEKPQGMPAQPDRTGDADLLSLLSAQMKQELGLVHRLDRPVGGIMVFAKTKQAEAALSKMMQAGGWRKSYLAVLWGTLEEKSGTWTDYLFKNARTNLSEVVSASRKAPRKLFCIIRYLQKPCGMNSPFLWWKSHWKQGGTIRFVSRLPITAHPFGAIENIIHYSP